MRMPGASRRARSEGVEAVPVVYMHTSGLGLSVCTACALRAHCVHTAHAEARILTQEYHSSVQ